MADLIQIAHGNYRVILAKRIRRKLRGTTDRGWVVLKVVAGGALPTVAWGVLRADGRVCVRGGDATPALLRRIKDAAVSYGLVEASDA